MLKGQSIIAGEHVPGLGEKIWAHDPDRDTRLDPHYETLTIGQLARATTAASEAFKTFKDLSPEERAVLLDTIADRIADAEEELIERGMAETGLPEGRMRGELGRTTGQLRFFAQVVREGDHLGVRVDSAQPDRAPLPRPDLRVRHLPVGPVAVFGASNFPLAFSVAGGDTASALAAGCPVIVKAHNAHPGVSEIVGRAVSEAVERCGLHPGVFSLIYAAGTEVGQALVAAPEIRAVGFTGSRGGGLALMRVAAARAVPIPVFAEMSSINPVFVYPGAIATAELRADVAAGFTASFCGSSGQLCTHPGLIFVPSGGDGDQLVASVGGSIADATGQTMLTPDIARSFAQGGQALSAHKAVERITEGQSGPGTNAPAPSLLETDVDSFAADPELQTEVFGAFAMVVRYMDPADLPSIVSALECQLTGTLRLAESDIEAAKLMVPALEEKVGRLIVNGWPTGVEVCHAMVHGGPFPATSDSRTTSVGSLAIHRFLRPVAYQDVPEALLPIVVADDNPWSVRRLVNGRWEATAR